MSAFSVVFFKISYYNDKNAENLKKNIPIFLIKCIFVRFYENDFLKILIVSFYVTKYQLIYGIGCKKKWS